MTRRAWAAGLLTLLTLAGAAITALHWRDGSVTEYVQNTVKPAASAEPYRLPSGSVNVNTADLDELSTLEGISRSQSEALIEDRVKNGGFDYPEDLVYVKGIGIKTLRKIFGQLDFTRQDTGN